MPLLNELTAPEYVEGMTVVITRIEQKQTKAQKPYGALTLQDKSGTLEARCWEWDTVSAFKQGSIIKVRGTAEEYRGVVQFKIEKARLLAEGEYDKADLVPVGPHDRDDILERIRSFIEDNVGDTGLQEIIQGFLHHPSLSKDLRDAPAASKMHHAYVGGLAQHTYSLLCLARDMVAHYQTFESDEFNTDALYVGILLHDFGKILEQSWDTQIAATTDGKLHGHIFMGAAIAQDILSNVDPELKRQIIHIILSHHGKREWGSPVIPQTVEALLFHQLDMIDSRMAMVRELRAKTTTETWSEYCYPLETAFYFPREASAPGEEQEVPIL